MCICLYSSTPPDVSKHADIRIVTNRFSILDASKEEGERRQFFKRNKKSSFILVLYQFDYGANIVDDLLSTPGERRERRKIDQRSKLALGFP